MTSLPFTLVCHDTTPPRALTGICGRLTLEGDWLRLRWSLEGVGALVVPPFAGKGRADDLWQTTCFELFVAGEEGTGYTEFNLSPSERWAAYDFTARREGMAPRPMHREPVCTLRRGESKMIFDAALALADLPARPWHCGVTAVIEEEGAERSYWALAHGAAQPDFHDPACFTLALAAPQRP